MDVVVEQIMGEKTERKESIDKLNDTIKKNPKSSANAKKVIEKRLKDTGIPAEIKKAQGNGSAKKPQYPEEYKKLQQKKFFVYCCYCRRK